MSRVARFVTALLFSCVVLFAGPRLSLSVDDGPPTATVLVSGTGFAPLSAVNIYFGQLRGAVSVTNSHGAFSNVSLVVPATALPGSQPVIAKDATGTSAEVFFLVQADWPLFLGDSARSGYNPYENVIGVKNASSLSLAWAVPASGASPVVEEGIVYTGSAAAFDTRTGAMLWTFPNIANLHSSPAVAAGKVYVGGYNGVLYALAARTGAQVWSFTTGGAIYSSPNVVNGVVYFGSYDDYVYALNASSGALIWKFKTGSAVQGSPAVSNGMVYAGSFDGTLYAINAATGQQVFGYTTGPQALQGSPAVVNGIVYFTSGNDNLYAIDQQSGSFLWSFKTGVLLTSSVAVANGVVYLPASDGYLYALDAYQGSMLWKTATAPLADGATVANGVVYVGTDSYIGFIYGINAKTGAVLWAYKTPAGISTTPAVVNGAVYLLGSELYKFQIP